MTRPSEPDPTGGSTAILVRHADSAVDPTQAASAWSLSPGGRVAAECLADLIARLAPSAIISSPEIKALQTAEPLARRLGLRIKVDADLREQEASGFLAPRSFQRAVRRHFDHPEAPVFGEAAAAAGRRFARAIGRYGEPAPLFVSHGRVMSAFLAAETGRPGWPIWQDLRMPDVLQVQWQCGLVTVARKLTGDCPILDAREVGLC